MEETLLQSPEHSLVPPWEAWEICFPKGAFPCRSPQGEGSGASVDLLMLLTKLSVYKAVFLWREEP